MRSIDITSNPDATAGIVAQVEAIPGVVSLAVHLGVSVLPAGDVVRVQCTNDAAPAVTAIAAAGEGDGISSWAISQPTSVVTATTADRKRIAAESARSSLEDVDGELRRDANLDLSYHLLMALSGGVAAVGLWTSQLQLVIGAMVIAPGFDPPLRVPFGIGSGDRATARRGAAMLLTGYGVMAFMAALLTVLLTQVTTGDADALPRDELVRYWSTVTTTSWMVSALGAMAGAIGVTALRRIVAPGAMIALALVPSASLIGMAAVIGSSELATGALARWAVDVLLIVVAGAAVILLERRRHPSSAPARSAA